MAMQSELSIGRITLLCLACCFAYWLLYGIVWEAAYDITTPPISSRNGYIIEHTVGIYIFLSVVAGIIFSIAGALLSAVSSALYASTRAPPGKIFTYMVPKNIGIIIIIAMLILNLLISVTPYLIHVK